MDRCIGVILSILAFRENDTIATLFSNRGILKLMIKTKRPPPPVFTEYEFLFKLGQGELARYRDGSILNQHLQLRDRFENLEAAGKLAQAILKSQMPGKAAPDLYQLFSYFLCQIPQTETPEDLVAIFLLKTLKHEGLLQQHPHCSVCSLKPSYRFGGERYCKAHAPPPALYFTDEEERQLICLSEGRCLGQLLSQPISLHAPIATLFDQVFSEDNPIRL